MTLLAIEGPGTDGLVSDRPPSQLRMREAEKLEDARDLPSAVLERRGWEYLGDTAVLSLEEVHGVWRAKFHRAGATRDLASVETSTGDYGIYIVNASGAGSGISSSVFDQSSEYLPRAQYRDMTIFCAADGLAPMLMYGGKAFASDSVALGNYTTDQSIITATSGTWADTEVDRGAFVVVQPSSLDVAPIAFGPVGERVSSTVLSVEGMKSSGSGSHGAFNAYSCGLAWPVVSVYDIGTISRSSTTITGVGTAWQNGDVPIDPGPLTLGGDGLLVLEPTGVNPYIYGVSSVSSDTSLSVGGGAGGVSNSRYEILRRCPFTDVAAHKSSLWGCGVAQHPNRVYVAPPGWNPAYPPYLALLDEANSFYDPETTVQRVNPADFKLGFVEVPGANARDSLKAILSSPGPLIALTTEHAYQVNGVYGSVSVAMLSPGAGCLDRRSAITTDRGSFWAGERGIYWYNNGGIQDLTANRINNEWRQLTAGWTTGDYVCLSLADRYLVASGKLGGTTFCYRFNLDTGAAGTISNVVTRASWSGRVDDETAKSYFSDVSTNSGGHKDRVCDLEPAMNGQGDAVDDGGTGPKFAYRSPRNLPQLVNIARPSRMTRVSVHYNARDTAGAGSNATFSVVTYGRLQSATSATTSLSDLVSQNDTDHVQRVRRTVGRLGIWHQVRIEKGSAPQSTQTRFRLERLACDLRASGREL